MKYPVDSTPEPEQHALYREMRDNDPVWSYQSRISGNRVWVFTRRDDVVEVARDTRFGVNPGIAEGQGRAVLRDTDELELLERHMLHLDPPEHTRLRSLVGRAFTARTVESLRPRIESISQELIDRMGDPDEVELMDAFAVPLPITVISEMLGVPIEDRERFRRWVEIAMGLEGVDGEGSDVRQQAGEEFVDYLRRQIHLKRESPEDDLLSGLIHATDEGDRLTEDELLAMVYLLLIAGHETTVNAIGNGMWLLAQHPDAQVAMRSDPKVLASGIEEILRFESPVGHLMTRFAREPVEFGDVTVEAGDIALGVLVAANRDPSFVEDPDQFDVLREPNRHLAFGFGIHRCIGAPLARLEMEIAFSQLLDRFPSIALADSGAEWKGDGFLRGLKSLRLKVRELPPQ